MSNIRAEVSNYLIHGPKYRVGRPEHYARRALANALQSAEATNFGIGAVLVKNENGVVQEFDGHNWMVTGKGIQKAVGHAETDAVLASLDHPEKPDRSYPNPFGEGIPPKGSVYVYGTLEPCPMCASVMSNTGVAMSVSNAADGELVDNHHGGTMSEGGAMVFGEKRWSQPAAWQRIQAGLGLAFLELETNDRDLKALSSALFLDTVETIDAFLASNRSK